MSCNDTVSCVNKDDDDDDDDDNVDGCGDCRAGSRSRNLTSFQFGRRHLSVFRNGGVLLYIPVVLFASLLDRSPYFPDVDIAHWQVIL